MSQSSCCRIFGAFQIGPRIGKLVRKGSDGGTEGLPVPGSVSNTGRKEVTVPAPGIHRCPELDRKQLAESQEEQVVVPVSCRKATLLYRVLCSS